MDGACESIQSSPDVGEMHSPRRARDAYGLAQKRSLLGDTLDQIDSGARRLRQRTGQHDTWKAAAAAKIDPGLCGRSERQELQRIGDMTRPEIRKRGGGDEIRLRLPLPKQRDIAIEPPFRFT